MDTNYYLEPSRPRLEGPAIPARMRMLVTTHDGVSVSEEPVLLYPQGSGSSPGGGYVSPIAMLASSASPAAHAAVRGHVVGWCNPL